MSDQKDNLIGVFDEQLLQDLKAKIGSEQFSTIVSQLVDHSLKAQADLSYDFNTAVNALLQKFPGKTELTVSEVHQTLRDLGIVDYKPVDFAYIEEVLKRFGVLVVPDKV